MTIICLREAYSDVAIHKFHENYKLPGFLVKARNDKMRHLRA
jgi:hypothetical protein